MLSDPKLEEMDRSVLKEMRRRFYEKRRKHRDQVVRQRGGGFGA